MLVLTVVICFHPSKARAQIIGEAINALSADIFESVDQSVNNFFNRVDDSIINFRLQADGILSRMRSDFADSLELTVQQLDTQQTQLWRTYVAALERLDTQIDQHLVGARITMLDFANAAGTVIPFSGSRPQIFWVEVDPPMFVHTSEHRTYTAYGLNLDHPANILQVNGHATRRASPSPTTLVFIEDRSDLAAGVTLEYSLFERGRLRDTRHNMPRVEFRPLSDYIGDLRLLYTEPVHSNISRRWPADPNQEISRECQNPNPTHRCGANIRPQIIAAREGHSILPDTIQRHYSVASGCRGRNTNIGFDQVTAASFRIFASVRASRGSGRKCSFRVHYTWQERANVGTPTERQTEFQEFRRSRNGVSLQYPAATGQPIAMEFRNHSDAEIERIGIPPLRMPLRAETQPGSGVVEVIWGR